MTPSEIADLVPLGEIRRNLDKMNISIDQGEEEVMCIVEDKLKEKAIKYSEDDLFDATKLVIEKFNSAYRSHEMEIDISLEKSKQELAKNKLLEQKLVQKQVKTVPTVSTKYVWHITHYNTDEKDWIPVETFSTVDQAIEARNIRYKDCSVRIESELLNEDGTIFSEPPSDAFDISEDHAGELDNTKEPEINDLKNKQETLTLSDFEFPSTIDVLKEHFSNITEYIYPEPPPDYPEEDADMFLSEEEYSCVRCPSTSPNSKGRIDYHLTERNEYTGYFFHPVVEYKGKFYQPQEDYHFIEGTMSKEVFEKYNEDYFDSDSADYRCDRWIILEDIEEVEVYDPNPVGKESIEDYYSKKKLPKGTKHFKLITIGEIVESDGELDCIFNRNTDQKEWAELIHLMYGYPLELFDEEGFVIHSYSNG